MDRLSGLPSLHYIHLERGSWCKVGERPTAFLMDTPGVMLPNVPDEQTGMRLALTGMASVKFALIQHCPVDHVGFADLCMCTCVCASLVSTELDLNISLAVTCTGVTA